MRRRSGAVEPPSGIAGWNGGRHRTPLPDCAARPAAIRSSWAPVEPGEGRLAELVRIEHVPDQRAAGIFVGIDLVEVAPDYDHSGMTAILAAQLLLNTIGRVMHWRLARAEQAAR